MNAAARVLALLPATLAVWSLAACSDRQQEARNQPSDAAKVIGVPPTPPQPDPATVQPVAPGVTELAKEVEISVMPLPGQADDPETVALLNSERSEAIDVLKDPELAKLANSDQALEAWRRKTLRKMQVAQLQRDRAQVQARK